MDKALQARPPAAGRQLEALALMLLSREFDRQAIGLQRQGRVGLVSPVFGQEAAVVGSCLAIDPATDWVVGQAREMPAYIHQGYPLERFAALAMGKVRAARIPGGVNLLPLQVAIGAQLPHAVGLAWGLQLRRKPGVVLCYFGEGASSEGDFHEACNLAGVTRAPVVFLLQNNQWAISTPTSFQTASESYAGRAAGYGFAGASVDGNDPDAVQQVTAEAVARARRGEGATLIEAITYRLGAHNTSDNPRLYVDPDEYARAAAHDPIERYAARLLAEGLASAAEVERMKEAASERVHAAFEAALGAPAPDPEEVFEDVYEDVPPRVASQRRQLRSILGRDQASG